jgi:hypothetical protein
MKKLDSDLGWRNLQVSVATLALVAGATQFARADAIPYANVGTENPVVYSFTATSTGDVLAYFAGSTAAYDNQLGMLINGVLSPSGYGLDNHSSALGQVFDLGHVNAGDSLVFVLHNVSGLVPPGQNVYSDPTLNGPYDGVAGHNHVYSTPYTQSPPIDGIPAGTYVAFEDLPLYAPPDWNYHDETFVFTDVSVGTVPDSTSTLALLVIGLAGIGAARHRLCA